MTFKSYREGSRENWGSHSEGPLNHDQIKLGAILRIADASEKIANNYAALINERDRYKRQLEEEKTSCARLVRSNAALRGVITRMKGKSK